MSAARNPRAAAALGADGAFDPPLTRHALAELRAPVTVIAGGVDVGLPLSVMQQLVDLFPYATLKVHFPWSMIRSSSQSPRVRPCYVADFGALARVKPPIGYGRQVVGSLRRGTH